MPRKKKPIKTLKKNGTYRPCRHDTDNDELPGTLLGEPPKPNFIKGSAEVEWKRIVKLLHKRGDLSPLHMAPIASYCLMWQRIHEHHTGGIKDKEPLPAAYYSEYRQHCAMLGVTLTLSPKVISIGNKKPKNSPLNDSL